MIELYNEMANQWVEFIRTWAKDHNISYSQAVKDPEAKRAYRLKFPVEEEKDKKKRLLSQPPPAVKPERKARNISKRDEVTLLRIKKREQKKLEKEQKIQEKKEREMMGAEDLKPPAPAPEKKKRGRPAKPKPLTQKKERELMGAEDKPALPDLVGITPSKVSVSPPEKKKRGRPAKPKPLPQYKERELMGAEDVNQAVRPIDFKRQKFKENKERMKQSLNKALVRRELEQMLPEMSQMGAEDISARNIRANDNAKRAKMKENKAKMKASLEEAIAKRDQGIEAEDWTGLGSKKRGRPRKYATPEEAKQAKAEKTIEAKKKRQATKKAEKEAKKQNITLTMIEPVGGKSPCYNGYEMIGTKKKKGKIVPNCVPIKQGGYTTDNYGYNKPETDKGEYSNAGVIYDKNRYALTSVTPSSTWKPSTPYLNYQGGAIEISNPEINNDWFRNYAQRLNQPLINYKGLADSIAHPNIAQVRDLVGKINGLIG